MQIFVVFLFYILKKTKYLPLVISLTSISLLFQKFDVYLVGYNGVHVVSDSISFYFILTNILCTFIVSIQLIRFYKLNTNFFVSLTHVVLNFLFISNDLFNIYVLLETLTILIVLLILSGEKFEHKLVSLKYIFASTVAMNIYLLGVGLHYFKTGSFDIQNISGISEFLMKSALISKAGIFLFGLWLPEVHSNAETETSALLSSIYTQSVLFALIRLGLGKEFYFLGIISFFFGAVFALFSKDLKKLLAFSTMSQLGIMLLNPLIAPFYVLVHGIPKTVLFLSTRFVERNLEKERTYSIFIFLAMFISFLSISGFSFTLGGFLKTQMVDSKILSIFVSFFSSLYFGKALPKKLKLEKNDFFIFLFLISLFTIYPFFINLESFIVIPIGILVGNMFFKKLNLELTFTTELILTFMIFSIGIFSLFGVI
jgi:multicomponent Na+:H+ antiporter subunit D/NAD(P)H-quinone oxidoreductase subunit 4